ncbi:MAG: hypothetical protein QT02_C0005G0015 [archaeon GW2011_AR9]|nr:MAG: hypothetical protein QT02_C0005G0015 [archaeon GW2011_AR9]MBS3120633.1 hypothetical protein [Candidatus Woesearchaeota archaeon]HIH13031.1 hypothetical protein [Candidatus Woesearchaeota archaeon]
MTWYDADINEEGVQELNRLFDDTPFSVRETPEAERPWQVSYVAPGTQTPIFAYNEDTIIMYHAVIADLSPAVRDDLESRLAKVTSLENVVQQVQKLRSGKWENGWLVTPYTERHN